MTTPYDGKVAIWHWKGDSLAEDTIEAAVRTLKTWAPHVTDVFVKTSDGADWMAKYDKSSDMGISGRDAITRWVNVLQANQMNFHGWCVPKGIEVEREADLVIEACNTEGVQSMILDIEPYAGFWQGGKSAIRPFMTRIRRGIGGKFHLGLSTDPRSHRFDDIYPYEWQPFVNSVHPQCYWKTFGRDVDVVLAEVYNTWKGYGLPIYPVLQGWSVPGEEITEARERVIDEYDAKGISYWRLGVIGAAQYIAINKPMTEDSGETDPNLPDDDDQIRFGDEIVITPEDPGFALGKHDQNAEFKDFKGTWGWKTYYKSTVKRTSLVWARWVPNIKTSGFYEVSVFIPARHAGTTNARYKLHGVKGMGGEITISIPQMQYFNLWVPLGIFEFDASNPRAGIIFLNDLTGEADKEIAFDAIRYRELIGDPNDQRYLSDGYDPPIGTRSEREGEAVWPGQWIDVTGYGVRYFRNTPAEAYHTGADLNLNQPYFDADRDAPVYAASSGTVTFSGRLPGWGWIIVIRHDPLASTGEVTYGRYAHVNAARVKVGDRVVRGQQIANVGNADGNFAYHLHFDLSLTDVLDTSPGDWPKLNLNRVLADYIDPREFIEENRPRRKP